MNTDTIIKVEIGMKIFWPGDKESQPVEGYKTGWIFLACVEGRYPLNEWIDDSDLLKSIGVRDKHGMHRVLFNDRCQKV